MKYNDPYMDWRPMAAHAPGCKRTGWEVLQHQADHITGRREIAVRVICPETGGCGVMAELDVTLAPDRDPDSGDVRSGESWSYGGVDLIGYGTRPQRVGDVWLHAGPPLAEWAKDEEGPAWWYVTRSAEPPTRHVDTLGKVFRLRKGGRQLKGRVGAGVGWKTSSYGAHLAEKREDLTSVRAAARWVEERAAAAAAGGETP